MKKPRCKLVGEDGNVFNVIGRVRRALLNAGQDDQAREFVERAFRCGSYDEVLQLVLQQASRRCDRGRARSVSIGVWVDHGTCGGWRARRTGAAGRSPRRSAYEESVLSRATRTHGNTRSGTVRAPSGEGSREAVLGHRPSPPAACMLPSVNRYAASERANQPTISTGTEQQRIQPSSSLAVRSM